MDKLYDTLIKAIREKCLNCSCWQSGEVRQCTAIDCPIYPYRMGTRPSEETLKTLEDYYSKNPKPIKEV